MIDAVWLWWRGGDALMPVMAGLALVLYAILAERSLVLWGVRRGRRRDEFTALLACGNGGDGRWRAWAAGYAGLAEAEELSRGFTVARALTAALPLLGLLGTVTGMVDTFARIGASGGMASSAAGAGIGLALTATQYGLALAIPAVAWEWLLARRVAWLVRDREAAVRQALAEAA